MPGREGNTLGILREKQGPALRFNTLLLYLIFTKLFKQYSLITAQCLSKNSCLTAINQGDIYRLNEGDRS